MPSAKDYVSRADKVHHQKRLLLCNLKELYTTFRNQNESIKIGFTKFCALRPKWCVLMASSGSHTVCVCSIHQIAKLQANACGMDYKDLMKVLVCDVASKNCMVHRCESCPGKSANVAKPQSLDLLSENNVLNSSSGKLQVEYH